MWGILCGKRGGRGGDEAGNSGSGMAVVIG